MSNRCRICGRPPTEECCPICHEAAARIDEDDQVNTEEVNQ